MRGDRPRNKGNAGGNSGVKGKVLAHPRGFLAAGNGKLRDKGVTSNGWRMRPHQKEVTPNADYDFIPPKPIFSYIAIGELRNGMTVFQQEQVRRFAEQIVADNARSVLQILSLDFLDRWDSLGVKLLMEPLRELENFHVKLENRKGKDTYLAIQDQYPDNKFKWIESFSDIG